MHSFRHNTGIGQTDRLNKIWYPVSIAPCSLLTHLLTKHGSAINSLLLSCLVVNKRFLVLIVRCYSVIIILIFFYLYILIDEIIRLTE